MGMYNIIKVDKNTEVPCPICGKNMQEESRNGEWQSKYVDAIGYDDELTLSVIPFSSVQRGEMHGMCEHCEAFVEVEIKDGKAVGGTTRL